MEERVKRLGGTIQVDSQPGAGTTVNAELPLNRTKV
jgi:signal transduction histidine kinase